MKNTDVKSRAKARPNILKEYWKYRYLFLLLSVGIIYYVIFHYIPMYGIIIAFKDYKFRLGILKSPWIGFENFAMMFRGVDFLNVFKNTLIISFYKLIACFPAPIILALLLNEVKSKAYKKTIQTISYLPHFLSWVILAGVFIQLLSPSQGPINLIIKSLGFRPIYFLGDPKWFRSTLVATSVWKGIGWGSIIYLASISSINPELYEAAYIDGANRFQQTLKITLPSIAPVIAIMFILNTGSLINDDFDQIFNLYNTAVYDVADVISTYTYRMGLVQMKYSFSTAVGLFKNIISFTLILITNYITSRFSEYGIW